MVFIRGTKVSELYSFLHVTPIAGKAQIFATAWEYTQISSITNI